VNKNQLNDANVDCKVPFNLVDLEKKKEFENSFEQDELKTD
jgi:hypothetical protein